MFEAIRSRLVGAWKDLRARGLPGLFVFELVVVTLGVLLAQGLAGWVSSRQTAAEVEGAHERLIERFAQARSTALIWEAAAPCLDQRMREVMRLASSDGTIDPKVLERPTFFGQPPINMSERMEVMFRKQYGEDDVVNFLLISRSIANHEPYMHIIGGEWYEFGRLDPENGEVSAADREAAKAAASAIRSQLRNIAIGADTILEGTDELGISVPADTNYLPVENCDQIWEGGVIALESKA